MAGTKSDWKAKLDAERVAAGVCRHCAGPLPCWSLYGDARLGVRHTAATLAKAKRKSPG